MQTELTWQEAAPGVWETTLVETPALSSLSVAGAKPEIDALRQMGDTGFPLASEQITVEYVGHRTVVTLPLSKEEALFGLGLQFQKLNQRGRTRYLRVNSDPVQDTGETHAPVPFYVSSAGYGVLVDTAQIVTIHCGSTGRKRTSPPTDLKDRGRDPDWQATPPADQVEIVFAGGGADLYLFAGPTPLDVVRRYNLFCGGGTLPPRWGLGFWHRVHYQYTDAQTLAEANEYRQRGYPCDVFGLEPGWHTKSYPCSFEWDPERFPDPTAFLAQMQAQGFRVNLWEHAYVSPASSLYAPLDALSGSHTVWGGLVPDYTLPEARELLGAQHTREHLERGVSGYKLDECDGSELTGSSWMFPAHATFPSGHDGERMRQIYGLLLQKLTTDLFRRRNQRTYGLVRASNAGASSLPYVLYSDLYNDRDFVRALCNSSFSGLLWTPEVRSARTAEEWVRRIQVVCFSPMALLNAWSDSTKPWSFPEVESIVRKYLQLRMRLLPYLYSAFARYHFEGIPPFRAMALEMPGASEVDDQWMVGDSLLVAPLFAGQSERQVLLPDGAWYDFETGERFEGGGRVKVSPGLDTLPVFVRDGGIIPLMPPLAHTPAVGEVVPLEVRHYGQKPGQFRLYEDDGETFDYEQGDFRWTDLLVSIGPEGTLSGHSETEGNGEPVWGDLTWRFMTR